MEQVFGYTRVSTNTQADKGYGIEIQRQAIKKYCKENNLKLIKIFEDIGISGTTLVKDRKGLKDLYISLNGINKVVVMNTSRLWREDTAKVFIRNHFKNMKVDLISIEQPNYNIYTKDPNEFLINGLLELLDQHDRMGIALKLAKGRRTKAKGGNKPAGNAPMGYKWNNAKIIIDEDKGQIVDLIFRKYFQLKSLTKLREYLIHKDIKTARGNNFSTEGLRKILRNDFYKGIVSHGDMKIEGNHEPIINKILFGKVQSQLKKNTRNIKT